MKKVIRYSGIVVFVLLLLVVLAPTMAMAVADPVIKPSGDRVSITYKGDPSKNYVLLIKNSKGDSPGPPSVIEAKGKEETFPMFNGNDTYEVSVLVQTPKGSYSRVAVENIKITDAKSSDPYLNACAYVDYGSATKTTSQAAKLAQSVKGASDQTKAIWDFIRNNYKYDYDKYKTGVASNYVPDLDAIFASKKGICMDTAAEMAGMLRSVGIPTRFVIGKTTVVKGAHAWVEVMIDKKWTLIDISVDIQKVEYGMENSMGDDAKEYSPERIY